MDAPTTTSAGNGTSGDSDGGGWFTPHTSPPSPGGDQEPEGNRLAALRPVGRSQKPPNGSQQNRESAVQERIHTSTDLPPSDPPRPQPAPATAEHASEHSALDARAPVRSGGHAATASPDGVLIQRTMAEVGPVADKVTSYFYALLFVQHPELRSMFPPAMDAQRDRLLKALLTAAEHIDNTPVLVDYLQNLGRGHRKYGTQADHYPAVGECLIGALSRYAKASWNDETEAAWVRAYTTISQVMIDAAAADELRSPPWWLAEVVSHEPRTADIAVLTVRPESALPLSRRAVHEPGDPLVAADLAALLVRLGAPLGRTVVVPREGDLRGLGLQCARAPCPARRRSASGTADRRDDRRPHHRQRAAVSGRRHRYRAHQGHRRGRRRARTAPPVEVFYGARTGQDLYDLDTLLRLQQSNSWLEVRPVVDRHGLLQLPDAIRDHGPWNGYDAYLSGPPGMIRSGVDALQSAGIPSDRIRHDSVEELVAAGD